MGESRDPGEHGASACEVRYEERRLKEWCVCVVGIGVLLLFRPSFEDGGAILSTEQVTWLHTERSKLMRRMTMLEEVARRQSMFYDIASSCHNLVHCGHNHVPMSMPG